MPYGLEAERGIAVTNSASQAGYAAYRCANRAHGESPESLSSPAGGLRRAEPIAWPVRANDLAFAPRAPPGRANAARVTAHLTDEPEGGVRACTVLSLGLVRTM